MSKKYAVTSTLVIVESPAKCKKIEGFLGAGYKCMASFGHLRELTSLTSVDLQNNFKANYTIADGKGKQIALLKSEIALANSVLLATDDDREGEAIAWHICMLFHLPVEKTKRIIFHEITESAVRHAVENPTYINMNIVYAQQTRQILDLLVGFKVSPVLWKYIAHQNLSAGRCQTPALKLIYDNQQEVERNPWKKVYNTTGLFQLMGKTIPFTLNKHHTTEEEMIEYLEASSSFSHVYSCTNPSKMYKKSPMPLTTSRLQQAASNELRMSPKETMKICQSLYEAGYITYMRTDSQTYCAEFIENVQSYIKRVYDETYMAKELNAATANIAEKKALPHEAIRPTAISLVDLPEKMDSKERKMYKLIWQTTLASCMASAEFFSITATIEAPENGKYINTSEQVSFLGWLVVTSKKIQENKDFSILQHYGERKCVSYSKIQSSLTMKDMKQHYTEARLVQLLEDRGIGRPSTFSSLVDKIQEREYVKRQDISGKIIECKDYELEGSEIFEIENKREFGNESGKLVIQPLGTIVVDFLDKHFADLFKYEYTSQMEEYLDMIASGSNTEPWHRFCQTCLDQITSNIDQLDTVAREKKVEYKIDEHHTYMIGKHGPVIKCLIDGELTFKSVKKNIDVHKLERGEYNMEDILEVVSLSTKESPPSLGKYEGKDLILKRGKFGIYVCWGDESKNLKCFGNRPIENISYADVIEILEKDGNVVRQISEEITIRKSKRGDYLFYKTAKMKKPQFFSLKDCNESYLTCDVDILKRWIQNTYNI